MVKVEEKEAEADLKYQKFVFICHQLEIEISE